MGRRTRRSGKRDKSNKRKRHSLKTYLSIILLMLIGIWMAIGVIDKEATTIAKVDNEEVDQIVKAESADLDVVEDSGYIVKPNFRDPIKGIIIYADGGVSPKAYLPLSITLAKKGYMVIIPEFLFNSPNIGKNALNALINKYKDIQFWVVAGHGGGGEAMSLNLTADEKIKGAVFLSSYPNKDADLSKSGLKVVSIKGTEDRTMNLDLYETRKKLLPEDTMFVQIENGNFSYFANYENDAEAKITKLEQQIQTSVQILNLLDQIR